LNHCACFLRIWKDVINSANCFVFAAVRSTSLASNSSLQVAFG
jgi:hypothetical protein